MAAILAICVSLFVGYRIYDWITQIRAELSKREKTENLFEESKNGITKNAESAKMDFTKDKMNKKLPAG